MRLQIDSHVMGCQPQALQWEPPQVESRDGEHAPIRGGYWTARLTVELNIQGASIQDWFLFDDSNTHTVVLPHPRTGVMTAFTAHVIVTGLNYNVSGECPVISGADIELSTIVVS